ncbi:hypothetical protein AWJ20_4284 [Sugiyamaella lignohabitans]|uniref:Uncharacterized protein n=1 Tax=Sugiyamaella lignohabitans TaxID=796027 RepID=A0A167CBL3_9ASCO|nr:uncharacterized protein AWJ20_4284 [Sugiyamaella lignohabitans]ANB11472.1 hypothetical protein AWJ20_4284 [Sugiyamaella lignohabitans]
MNEPDDPFYKLYPVREYLRFVAQCHGKVFLSERQEELESLREGFYQFGYLDRRRDDVYSLPHRLYELQKDNGRSALDTLKRIFYMNLEYLCPYVELFPCILDFLISQSPDLLPYEVENLSGLIKAICRKHNVRVLDDWQKDGPYSNFREIVALFVAARSPPRIQQELVQMFEEKHMGPMSGPFFSFIKETIRKVSDRLPRVYSPCVHIFQGSMYGKSRLIKDLASHHVYLSYMCLGRRIGFGYPSPRFSHSINSSSGLGYLDSHDEVDFAGDVLLFLVCTLQVIVEGLEHNDDNYTTVEKFWTFQETSSVFEQTIERSFAQKKRSEKDVWQSPSAITVTQDNLILSQKIRQLLRSEWAKYSTALKRNKDTNKEKYFVLAIDDAGVLNMKYDQSLMSFSYFQMFKKVAHCLVAEDLWGGFAIVLASTSALRDYDVSFSDSVLMDVETWCDLDTFDLHVRWGEKPLTLDFSDIGTLRFYAKFGRPMWKQYVDRGQESELLADASAKLRGRYTEWLSKHHTLLVIYAPVMNLDFRTAESLVGSRMATVLSVSDQRDVLKVGYPSEPILVMAAHKILEGENDLDLISHLLSDKVLSPANASEFIARWMLLDVLKTAGLRDGLQSNYCRVRDLFNGLNEKYHVTCSSGHPNEHHLLNERIHLNHWMTLDSECTMQMLALGFLRGCGFCFERRDRDFDLVIPIYLESRQIDLTNIRLFEGDEDSQWGLAELSLVSQAFSVLLIHVSKNENSRSGHYASIHDRMAEATQMIFGRYKPIISLHMKLRAGPPTSFDQKPRYNENWANVFTNQEDWADIHMQERKAMLAQDFNLAYDLHVTAHNNSNSEFIDRLQNVVSLSVEGSESPSKNDTLLSYATAASRNQIEVIEKARQRKRQQQQEHRTEANDGQQLEANVLQVRPNLRQLRPRHGNQVDRSRSRKQ